MNIFSRKLLLAFLFLTLVVPPVVGDEPPKNGPHIEYYENGQKMSEIHYKNDKRDGLWTYWDENGKKEIEGHHKNGELDGLETWWHENGQKMSEGHFKNGKKDGLWTEWHENGTEGIRGSLQERQARGPSG